MSINLMVIHMNVKKYDFRLVNCDTDSISFCKQDGSPFSKAERSDLLIGINDILPKLIVLEDDGYFDNFVVIKSKNYIMKNDNNIKFKGSSLLDQKKEPAMLDMVKEIGNSLLNGINYNELQNIYNKYIKEAVNLTDIRRFCAKKTITKAVLACEKNQESRLQERKLYDAMQGKNLSEGDKMYVFDSLDGVKQKVIKGEFVFNKDGTPKMVENIILRTSDNFNNNAHLPKLVQRVYATLSIFKTVIDITQFLNYTLKKNENELKGL